MERIDADTISRRIFGLLTHSPTFGRIWYAIQDNIIWLSPIMEFNEKELPPLNYRNLVLGSLAGLVGVIWLILGSWLLLGCFALAVTFAFVVNVNTAETFTRLGEFFMMSSENLYIFDLVYDNGRQPKQELLLVKRIPLEEITAVQIRGKKTLVYTDSLVPYELRLADMELIAAIMALNPDIIDPSKR